MAALRAMVRRTSRRRARERPRNRGALKAGGTPMPVDHSKLTRRTLLAGAATLAAAPRTASAQPAKQPTKVLDFMTTADMDKVKEEGAFVFYCHENEAGTAAIAEGFGKDFPQVKTSYVRAQTGALYNKILSERAAGRFDVDVLQLSDLAPALDFQKKGGYAIYQSPEAGGYRSEERRVGEGWRCRRGGGGRREREG